MKDLLKSSYEYIVVVVILKVIVAHWLAERILNYTKKLFNSSERNLAIWTHYQARATGHGHVTGSVLACADGTCAIFKA